MNCGVLCVTAASAEQVTCGLYIIPCDILQPPAAPGTIYDQAQLNALLLGGACVPALAAISGSPSLVQLSGAIPDTIPTGTTLPYVSVLTAQTADTWTADSDFELAGADIIPYCNPEVVTPTLGSAWALTMNITYAHTASRDLFNPDDYEPPVYVTDTKKLYFPKPDRFARSTIEIMRDNALSNGLYWYRSYALLRPSYIFLYQTPGCAFFVESDLEHPFLTVAVDAFGMVLTDQAFLVETPSGWAYRDAFTSKWYNVDPGMLSTSGFQRIALGLSSIAGRVYSAAPEHWSAPDFPAKVRPGQKRKAAGIVAPVTTLLLLGSLLMVGAASPTPGRRRRKF